MVSALTAKTNPLHQGIDRYDAVVIGAGPSGLYELHLLREKGLRVLAIEAGGGVGGTWYWNRYPGCRLHSESYTYQYFWSEELLDEWQWSEVFAGQPELERYYNLVADKYDLRKDILFDTRVEALTFDESADEWQVRTDQGNTVRARAVVATVGMLSAPIYPDVPGLDSFEGQAHHTSRWPHEGVDFRGKRVAVIGTGASGVQVIPQIAKDAAHLSVLVRTPNYVLPLRNRPLDAAESADLRARANEIHDRISSTMLGFTWSPEPKPTTDYTPEELRAHYEKRWQEPGWAKVFGLPHDILLEDGPNKTYADFILEKSRPRIHDAELAEKLMPKHAVMAKPADYDIDNYYEVFNQDNVDAVFVQDNPIEAITPTGIRLRDGRLDVDVIVYATGFEVHTGAFKRIDIIGAGGVKLKEVWNDKVVTYLGLMAPGFPNLFLVGGPNGRAASGNCPIAFEVAGEWIADTTQRLVKGGYARLEADPVAAQEWGRRIEQDGQTGVGARSEVSSYAYGTNVAGHKRQFLAASIPLPEFNTTLREIAEADFTTGFILS
ncbi:flavin-containing monooxygenase [Streptomyces cavernae]|uniref:flavin-containing monooxygenase n=1 Tax=Streptomyces cavernae TaxID=2259034 RepID=UPI000FEBB2B3|nr:NAD(P)/FAD-dependent oxidoreductase [Streptomyces cavernae]